MVRRRADGFKDLKTEHLECRSWTHAWESELTVMGRYNHRPVYIASLICMRCTLPATDVIYVSDGSRAKPRQYGYKAVPDYLIEDLPSWGGASEFKRNARIELYGRFLKEVKKNGRKTG